MNYIFEKVEVTCKNLFEIANRRLFEITNIEYMPAEGYKPNNDIPEKGWLPFSSSMRVRGKDAHFWFRTAFRSPAFQRNTSYYLRITTGFEGQWDATNPQGLIYLNGEMVQGCDTNHTEVYLDAGKEYILHNYFYIGMIEAWVPLEISMYACDEKTEELYYDLCVPLESCKLLHKNSDEYINTMSVLEQTCNLLDLRAPGSEAYAKSVEEALTFIHNEFYEKMCSTHGKPVVSCIGHTHIDVEWLWNRAQTREKIQRSFSTAESLMRRYPEYRFMLSQPELYRYLKEEAPQKYDELRRRVDEGRWEPEGAMWVEADCNLISGESFVRQILHGKKFFKEEFGVDCKILFLPDVFGYSAAMPQILNKSGIRHFVTSKISWNETNTMPVDAFLWEGIDGTEIFTNFITAQEYTGAEPSNFTTYNALLNPSQVKGTWNRFSQKEYANRALQIYGYGDGGGGPTKKMLEYQRRMAKGLPGMPVTRMESLLHHLDLSRAEFDEGCKRTKRIPKWVGELYLEFHRGTYTSIAKNKRGNRKSELALQKAETLSCIDMILGGAYDAEGIYDNWKKVLHNQFHDIIPGSSIFEVYEGTDKDYAEIGAFCDKVIEEKLHAIARSLNTERGMLVYNSLGFACAGPVKVNGVTIEVTDPIPAFGWRVIKSAEAVSAVKVEGLTAENKYYVMQLDASGRIISLFDKRAGREVFVKGQFGNEVQLFEDYPRQYDNWELSDYYKQKCWVLEDQANIVPIFDGSRGGFRVSHNYMNSTIVQCIWLYSDCERIDFDNEIGWHQHHQVMKVAFPLDVHTMSATYEIQYGHVSRPTYANTSWDQAKFEVYGHKWVDLSENGYGVSLLNDCKYGYNTEGSTLKITALKCGTYPNHEADQGKHVFTYSLLPHVGDFREAGVIHAAYQLNQPLTGMEIGEANGSRPKVFSLVTCDKANVIVETVKKAEVDDGMIVRMYEAFDRRTTASITVAGNFKKAYLCDLMENVEKELDFDGYTVRLPVSNFEIITVKFVG